METRAALASVLCASLLLLAACGGSDNPSTTTSTGSNSSSQPGSSSQPAATPTATLSAGSSAVTSGSATTLTWSSTNASSCTASGAWSGTLATSGSQSTGNLTAAQTYSLTCTGSGGTSSSASVTVNVTPISSAPTATLTASANAVASGGSTTLNWSSTNATSCTASGAWSGTLATSGSQGTGTLTAAKTYSLSCTGAGGTSSTVSATVNITPTATLSASPTTVASGGTSTLTWSSTNATACTASNGWSGTRATSGSQATTALTATTTYSLVCTGAGGSSSSATATVTVASGTVSVTPGSSAITSGQTLQFSASVPGNAAANWSVDTIANGNSSVGTISSTGLYTGGTSAGVHTVTATSSAVSSQSGSATVAVTSLAGVYTYHNDVARDGANQLEYALTPTSVTSSSFHKLFSCNVDGAIYGQPLWVAQLTVNSAKHNVVIVATAHDSLYAFDADTSPCVTLWSVSLIDTAHGAGSGETSVPSGASGLVGSGYGDMTPEVGITGTPVIDPSTNTLYAVSKSVLVAGSNTFYQRLHAIDITTGSEKTGSPVLITAAVAGTGTGSSGGLVSFNSQTQFQRAGLALANGTVYVAYASHEDTAPYFGWVLGYTYSGTTFTALTTQLNVAPNDTTGKAGGIWMSGGAPAVDGSGNLYFLTGNGTYDTGGDYGDSLLQVSSSLGVLQYFTPSDQNTDKTNDRDFGSGGTVVLADLPVSGSTPWHVLLGGGKDGSLYALNRDILGSYDGGSSCSTTTVSLNCTALGHGIFSTGAYWNNTFYIVPGGGSVTSYALTANSSGVTLGSTSTSSASFGWPGATPSLSASGTQNGILWVINTHNYCTNQSSGCGPAVLYAYNATSLSSPIWSSPATGTSATSNDVAGNAVKFTVPTIANGKVYVGTRGSNTGAAYVSTCSGSSATNACGELDVYGLSD